MKKFKYNHHPAVYALLFVILIATAAGCFFAISGLIRGGEPVKTIAFAALCVVNVFLFAFVLALLIRSDYALKDGKIVVKLGFIKESYKISEIAALTHLIDAKKLLITFKDGKYVFAVVLPSVVESFANEILKINREIIFDVNYVSPLKNK